MTKLEDLKAAYDDAYDAACDARDAAYEAADAAYDAACDVAYAELMKQKDKQDD